MGKRSTKTPGEIRAQEMFGASARALREDRGWTLDDVGQAVNMSGDLLGKYERGERGPSILLLLRLSQLYGVTIDRLVCGHSSRPKLAPIAKIDEINQSSSNTGNGTSNLGGNHKKTTTKKRSHTLTN